MNYEWSVSFDQQVCWLFHKNMRLPSHARAYTELYAVCENNSREKQKHWNWKCTHEREMDVQRCRIACGREKTHDVFKLPSYSSSSSKIIIESTLKWQREWAFSPSIRIQCTLNIIINGPSAIEECEMECVAWIPTLTPSISLRMLMLLVGTSSCLDVSLIRFYRLSC